MRLTYTNLVDQDKDDSAKITSNGTTTASIAGIENGDTVTAKVTVGSLSQSVNVKVGEVGGKFTVAEDAAEKEWFLML